MPAALAVIATMAVWEARSALGGAGLLLGRTQVVAAGGTEDLRVAPALEGAPR